MPETGKVHRAALCLPTPSLWPTHGCLSPHPLPTGPIIFLLLGEMGSPCPHKGPSVGPLSFLGHFFFSPLPAHPTPKVFPSALCLGNTTHPSSSSSAPPCPHLSWEPGWRFSRSPGNSTIITVAVWTEPCGSRLSSWGQEEGRCTDDLCQSRTALNSFTL